MELELSGDCTTVWLEYLFNDWRSRFRLEYNEWKCLMSSLEEEEEVFYLLLNKMKNEYCNENGAGLYSHWKKLNFGLFREGM